MLCKQWNRAGSDKHFSYSATCDAIILLRLALCTASRRARCTTALTRCTLLSCHAVLKGAKCRCGTHAWTHAARYLLMCRAVPSCPAARCLKVDDITWPDRPGTAILGGVVFLWLEHACLPAALVLLPLCTKLPTTI